jgi:hypothetical protein
MGRYESAIDGQGSIFATKLGVASKAQDLTQDFFLHLLEHETLVRADPLKGRFRSFLLGSLQNYLSTEADRARLPETRWKGGVCLSGLCKTLRTATGWNRSMR